MYDPDPWPAVLTRAGFKRAEVLKVRWTAAGLRRALKAAAEGAGRNPDEFLAAVRGRLHQAVDEIERVTAERRTEEARLVAKLIEERAAAAAVSAAWRRVGQPAQPEPAASAAFSEAWRRA